MKPKASSTERVAIVTGAGSGIGRTVAIQFARSGCFVVLAGRRKANLLETEQAIQRDDGKCLARVSNVVSEESVAELMGAATGITGRIDILINCAGVSAITDAAKDQDGSEWSAIIETNLNAVYRCIRLSLPHTPDGGRIINIASVLGLRAAPMSSAYVASKHGLVGLTKSLALDLASRRITVNAICPGWVDTDMARDIIQSMAESQGLGKDQVKARIREGIPLGRMVEAEEVAALAAFLAGPAGAAITGQAIAVCAGSSLV